MNGSVGIGNEKTDGSQMHQKERKKLTECGREDEGAGEGEESKSNAVFRGEAENGRMYSVSEDERGVDAGELNKPKACLSSLPSEPRARQRSTIRETSTGNMSCNRSFAVRVLENTWRTRKVDCEEEEEVTG